ncbi:DUF1330 domain-containing protein [Phenylobacterium sp. SCN 70-31]|uniref:DUF1330 domain-containing protein n=1 Tax=Phenylobacterium sp. SCN 70-31 TaxID=1660129 RepID=UPI00086CBCFE|nr:DUF1330 domain-containing protein [Phenylobacterium sp. SCN 70-31]ODT89366.1 MAG: hypothetical protein ABS78_04075 [Phenylobacterium sp. SCN 70-31]
MPAYVIFIKNRTVDADELKTYSQKAAAARGDHPIKPLAFYGPVEVLEGDAAEGVVLIEFPDKAAAKAWYDSPAYQEAKQHRLKGGDYRIILVEGLG